MSEVLTERDGAILVITLNRPQARNAINEAVARGIAAAVDELDGDDTLRAGVITGAPPAFCSGMDLKSFAAGEDPHIEGRGFAGIVQAPPKKPLIAAVEGFAVAGGLEVALCADLIVAASDARFGIPEVKRGLVAAGGGVLRLPQRVPQQLAMEMALTGEMIDAQRAAANGLVARLSEPGDALRTALELARQIIENAPLAVAASKRILSERLAWPVEEQWERQAEITAAVFASEDCREGAVAFAEKRPPVWRAR
jgi:enoyl-CoA hydratase